MSGFWARFAQRVKRVGDVTMLENRFLPMLEVNAAYGAEALEQPISIRITGSQLEGDDLAGTLIALEFKAVELTSSLWVEQVAWTQAPQLARIWCDQNAAGDWESFVSREFARSLERDTELLAYLAYRDDNAAGMMIASSDGICGLWAGANDVAQALFARGAHDFERLEVTVPLERRHDLEAMETARFEIVVTGNSDRHSLEASR